jgi:hypothetical protein
MAPALVACVAVSAMLTVACLGACVLAADSMSESSREGSPEVIEDRLIFLYQLAQDEYGMGVEEEENEQQQQQQQQGGENQAAMGHHGHHVHGQHQHQHQHGQGQGFQASY